MRSLLRERKMEKHHWPKGIGIKDIGIAMRFYFLNKHGSCINTFNSLLLSEDGYDWKETEFIPLNAKAGCVEMCS